MSQSDKEVSLRTLAAQNAQRKRKLGDVKGIVGQVSHQQPNIVHISGFTFTHGGFQPLYLMFSPGNFAPRTAGAGEEAEGL